MLCQGDVFFNPLQIITSLRISAGEGRMGTNTYRQIAKVGKPKTELKN